MSERVLEPPLRTRTASAVSRPRAKPGRIVRPERTSLQAEGELMVWLTGGALFVCAMMIVGLLALIAAFGMATFWPQDLLRLRTLDGRTYMGEVTRTETYRPDDFIFEQLDPSIAETARARLDADGAGVRNLVRTGNFKLTQNHFNWVDSFLVEETARPEWAVVVEPLEWGRFYGFPEAFVFAEPLARRDADGEDKASEVLREEARRLLDGFTAREGGTPSLLVAREIDGEERVLPAPVAELETAQVVGIAELVVGPQRAWELFLRYHDAVRERFGVRRDLEKYDTGRVNRIQEEARLAVREAELQLVETREEHGSASEQAERARQNLAEAEAAFAQREKVAEAEFTRIRAEIDAINRENAGYQLLFSTAGEGSSPPQQTLMALGGIVRAYPANQLGLVERLGIYLSRWFEFLTAEPREANSEGGVLPAIFGTVAMTLIMALAVVPFGVLAALYLREYAKAGPIVSAVRIAVNNLAGVPSIVFGVFGLGFFCYVVGANLDELLFRAQLPNPTFGKGGLMWASLTLALLTLPVVIVATEEALSAVPNSMREGSYACGASKWQTIKRIVLPRAMPGIMTGMILAMARGAGEVAPLMLVGAVKLAPELPIDGFFPYVHPERSFMHLGFHVFDVGFQSQNSEAAKPMVYTTTLLLIAIIFLLNVAAIGLRKRLGRRFDSGAI